MWRARRAVRAAGPPRQPTRGRPRSFCSGACRSAAQRRRADGPKVRGLVSLRQADVHTFLAGIPDESVDLVVTDPPYEFDRGTTYFRQWFSDLPDEAWPAILAELHRVLRMDRHAYVICDERTNRFWRGRDRRGFRLAKDTGVEQADPGLGGGGLPLPARVDPVSREGNIDTEIGATSATC